MTSGLHSNQSIIFFFIFFDINNFTTCDNLLLDEKKYFFINQLWAIEDEKNSIYVTPDEISISIDGDNLKLPY